MIINDNTYLKIANSKRISGLLNAGVPASNLFDFRIYNFKPEEVFAAILNNSYKGVSA